MQKMLLDLVKVATHLMFDDYRCLVSNLLVSPYNMLNYNLNSDVMRSGTWISVLIRTASL